MFAAKVPLFQERHCTVYSFAFGELEIQLERRTVWGSRNLLTVIDR